MIHLSKNRLVCLRAERFTVNKKF